MKSVLILVGAALIAFSKAEELNQDGLQKLEQQNCGVFNEKSLSLNNNEVNPGSRPWMALLKIRFHDNNERFACMGTLITDQFVLTAAHCIKDNQVKSVRLGEHDQSRNTDCRTKDNKEKCQPSFEDIDVARVFIHENFNVPLRANDIALLLLTRKVEFKEHISPICLPLNAELQQQVDSLQSMLLTGWGIDEIDIGWDSKTFNILRETDLPYSDREACSKGLRGVKIEPSQFCNLMNGILCRGTSGSPMSKTVQYLGKERFVQFGIITYGATGCTTSTPVVSTNVGTFMPWLTRVLGQLW